MTRTKIFIVLTIGAIIMGLIAIASYAIHIEGTTKAEKKKEMQEEISLVNKGLDKASAEGKMAGQVDMGNQFVNQTQGQGQLIGDDLAAQAELNTGDWIDPMKKDE
ncbi:hypothetical protein ACFL4E_03065 [Candidatus Omnitrophota bacterium]